HWSGARRSGAEVPRHAPKPVLELSSTVRVCDGEFGCAGQAPAAVQAGGLRDTIREVQIVAGSGRAPQGGREHGAIGATGVQQERYGVRQEDGGSESHSAEEGEDRITDAAAVP